MPKLPAVQEDLRACRDLAKERLPQIQVAILETRKVVSGTREVIYATREAIRVASERAADPTVMVRNFRTIRRGGDAD
jgi:hypothetical protein